MDSTSLYGAGLAPVKPPEFCKALGGLGHTPDPSGRLSQISVGRRCIVVTARSEAFSDPTAAQCPFDFEAIFRAQYGRISRVITRIIGDPARAEELAVEVFLKFWQSPQAQGGSAEGWLHRVAVRKGLDELRRRARRSRYESLIEFLRAEPTPEEAGTAAQEQEKVRWVLAAIDSRDAELLLLRNQDLSYHELASALDLNPASIGTLLGRAQKNFRKEYIKRYGEQRIEHKPLGGRSSGET